MNPIFGSNPKTKLGSNTFDLTHDRKISSKLGYLTPIICMDIIPGDKIDLRSSAMVRFAPMVAPVYARCNVYCHFFFVPNRIIWDNWETFITGYENGSPGTPSTAVWPYINYDASLVNPGDLSDHLGLPVAEDVLNPEGSAFNVKVSALPFAAYHKIYDDYYRDQNLNGNTVPDLSDGDNTTWWNTQGKWIQTRAWQHDYFTSALPWAQKGQSAMLPLTNGTQSIIQTSVTGDETVFARWRKYDDQSNAAAGTMKSAGNEINVDGTTDELYYDPTGSLTAEFSDATIVNLRRAVRLQEFLEKDARGGSRYIENIQAHFGVHSSDGRLQRPEYIGGSKNPIKISEVLQTSASPASGATESETPQGNMVGHGVSMGTGDYGSYRAEEHGYIIGIMSVMPEAAYQQGIPRHFSRPDKFDYYWPEFAHIGEQAILNQELYLDTNGGASEAADTFGYTPRYSEYKFINNTVHGDFKTNLDFWHMGRKWAGTPPALNNSFIQMDFNEVERIFAVADDDDHLWCHVLNEVKARRKMPVFGTPKL